MSPLPEKNILIKQYRGRAGEIYRIFKVNCELGAS